MADKCPNCNSDLAASVESADGETIKPDGGVLVCTGCSMAVSKEDLKAVSTEEPKDLSENKRGEEGPPRIEDQPGFEPGQVDATPAAEDLATEKGVDLTQVEGTGSGGKVTKEDVANA